MKAKKIVTALALVAAAATPIYPQTTVPTEHLSVSVTPGGSARLLSIDLNGSPQLYDNPVGEHAWMKSVTSGPTTLTQDATLLGLPNAEIRVFAAAASGVTEFRPSGTADPWPSQIVDEREAKGQPCALVSGGRKYLFAQRTGGGIIALADFPATSWAPLAAVEAPFRSDEVAALTCGSATATHTVAVAATLMNGGVLMAVFPEGEEGRIATVQLNVEAGASPDVTDRVAIAGSGASFDVFGITGAHGLLHWKLLADGSPGIFERISPAGVPLLDGAPAAVWHDGRLVAGTRTMDRKLALFTQSQGKKTWTAVVPALPAGDAVKTAPQFVPQPGELSALVLLQSGSIVQVNFDAGSWTAQLLNTAGPDASAVARATAPADKSNGAAQLAAAPTQTLNQFIDSIPALPAPVPQPPRVTSKSLPATNVAGVDFDNVELTTDRSANLSEAITSNPNSDVIWPGSLVQGKTIQGGLLASIGLARAPLAITVTDVLGTGPLSVTVQNPSLGTVVTGIRDLLKNLNIEKGTAALYYDSKAGNTEEDAMLNLGISADFLGQSVKASVKSSSTQKTNTIAAKFVQRYYSLAVDTPPNPGSVFAPGVTAEDAKRFIGAGNPPAYVSQVSYGRELIYLFESTESTDTLKATVDAVFKIVKVGGEVHLDAQQTSILNRSHIRMFALGGGAEDALKLVTGQEFPQQLKEYLSQGANFSFASPGAPLSYTVKFLKDGTVAQINSATQWKTTVSYARPVSGSFIIGLGNTNQRDCKDWPSSRNIPSYPIGVVHTNFVVRDGDQVVISALGQVWSGVFATGFNSPDGWTTWKTPTKGIGFPNEEVHPFSLLYRIGGTNPPPFAGSAPPPITYSGSTGAIDLLINTNNFNGGSGCFKVNVTVQRKN